MSLSLRKTDFFLHYIIFVAGAGAGPGLDYVFDDLLFYLLRSTSKVRSAGLLDFLFCIMASAEVTGNFMDF